MATGDEQAPEWAVGMVLTELRRVYPDSVEKNDLQELLGIGPRDLRAALEQLEASGEVRPDADGYVYVEVQDRQPAAQAGGDVLFPADATDEEEDQLEEEPAARELPAREVRGEASIAEPHYRVRIALDVTFALEGDDGDAPDVLALREAEDIRVAAMNGILAAWPDLAVSSAVETVHAFDEPRQVYPDARG